MTKEQIETTGEVKYMSNTPKVALFISGLFAWPSVERLIIDDNLTGVILPDPQQNPYAAQEINQLAFMLKQQDVAFQFCSKENLSIIVEQLKLWQVNVGFVITYPDIFPLELISFFSLGLYNIHASALPKYPGSSPLYWQIRNAESEVGLTVHYVTESVDGGNIVAQYTSSLHELDTFNSLSNRLSYEASLILSEVLQKIRNNEKALQGEKQTTKLRVGEHVNSTREYARRPLLEDFYLDFQSLKAKQISAICRAGNAMNSGAIIGIKGTTINLLQATSVDFQNYGTAPGTIICVSEPEGLIVSTIDGALRLDIISNIDGVFSGLAFAERFQIDAGLKFEPVLPQPRKSQ